MQPCYRSPRGRLNTTELKKVGKGAVIAMLAALLYSLEEATRTGNFELTTVFVLTLASTVVNFVHKLITGPPAQPPSDPPVTPPARQVDVGEGPYPYPK